jgi:hypothetical protein
MLFCKVDIKQRVLFDLNVKLLTGQLASFTWPKEEIFNPSFSGEFSIMLHINFGIFSNATSAFFIESGSPCSLHHEYTLVEPF